MKTGTAGENQAMTEFDPARATAMVPGSSA